VNEKYTYFTFSYFKSKITNNNKLHNFELKIKLFDVFLFYSIINQKLYQLINPEKSFTSSTRTRNTYTFYYYYFRVVTAFVFCALLEFTVVNYTWRKIRPDIQKNMMTEPVNGGTGGSKSYDENIPSSPAISSVVITKLLD